MRQSDLSPILQRRESFPLVTNLLWLIGVLSALLLWNFSKSWVTAPKLSNIISLALSLSSTILAVIAIVQTLISNAGASRAMANISDAAQNILEVSAGLGDNASKLDAVIDIIQDMPRGMAQLGEQIGQLSTNASVNHTQKPTTEAIDAEKFDTTSAFSRTSVGCTITLYGLMMSYKAKKPFQFLEIPNIGVASYKEGVVAGIALAGIMDMSLVNGIVEVKGLGPFKESEIVVWMNINAENSPVTVADKAAIDAFFASELAGA